jgi:hypothetical protein
MSAGFDAGWPSTSLPFGWGRSVGWSLTVDMSSTQSAAVTLYWIPLGSGGHVVRWNGKLYEAIRARIEHRSPLALYHSALSLVLGERSYAIEVTPIPDEFGVRRGVVGTGPVGSRWLGRLRIFRYEVRCWSEGEIPDSADPETQIVTVSDDSDVAQRVLESLPDVPTPVWGRDELSTGDMWNSNSVVSWALAVAGVDVEKLQLPAGGRAPGWDAGVEVAHRVHLPATGSLR